MTINYDALGGSAEKQKPLYERMTKVKVTEGVYQGEKGYIMKVEHDLHGRACYQVMIGDSGQTSVLAESEIKPRKGN